MGKKMKLPSLFKSTDAKSTWPWPSCRQPRTLSFRTTSNDILSAAAAAVTYTSDSYFTVSSECGSFSTVSESSGGDPIERMIRGLRSSERLVFEPAGKTSSILKEETEEDDTSYPFKESTTILSMDSEDPYLDFRKSMEEMVEAHGLKDWKSLEELLSWYLRVNRKGNHEYILGAFVDLLVSLALASQNSHHSPLSLCSSSSSSSFSSSSSSFIPCVSSLQREEITSLEEKDASS